MKLKLGTRREEKVWNWKWTTRELLTSGDDSPSCDGFACKGEDGEGGDDAVELNNFNLCCLINLDELKGVNECD